MKRKAFLALLLAAVFALSACSAKSTAYENAEAPMAAYDSGAVSSETAYSYAANNKGMQDTSMPDKKTDTGTQQDADVRKIIYNASMTVTADAPDTALAALIEQAAALGGYLAGSYTNTDELGAYRCTATLKVPADRLEELVNAAKAAGKVESYSLDSEDISLDYYDIVARLDNAKAEEKQLLAILEACTTVEDILAVRQSLTQVRADIESYQGRINLWDNLVSYATLELNIRRTPRASVEKEPELLAIWKASDVWQRMINGFQNSARFMVNFVGAIGIFLAYALIPLAVVALIVFLWIKIDKKGAARRAERRERRRARKEEARARREANKK